MKELKDKLARLAVQMHDLTTLLKTEKRGFSDEERTKWNAMVDDFDKTEEAIKAAEKSDGIAERLAASAGTVISKTQIEELRDTYQLSPAEKRRRDNEKDPHAKAFSAYLRTGERLGMDFRQTLEQVNAGVGLPGGIRNTMATTPGSQGGYLIPQGFSGILEEAKKWFGGIEGVVEKFTTGTGNPFPWPTVNDTTNRGRIIGQNVQNVETDIVFGQVTFQAYIGSSDLILIPLALIEDSFFDMDALAARLLGIRLGRLFNWKCTVGSGTAEPTGIVTAATTSGHILVLATGNTASIAYNNLVDLEHTVDPAYRETPSTRWMFNDTMLKLLKKLVDGQNRPLWQPGLTSSFRDGAGVMQNKPEILNHPYVINNDMAVPAANAYTIVFGDMSTFKVREVAGGTTVLVLRERYADYLQVGFLAFQRFDSNEIDAGTGPLALLQQSAT